MQKEWKIENIPVPDVKLYCELDKDTGILKVSEHIFGYVTEKIVELNSQAIREALIEMGWTPPGKEHE